MVWFSAERHDGRPVALFADQCTLSIDFQSRCTTARLRAGTWVPTHKTDLRFILRCLSLSEPGSGLPLSFVRGLPSVSAENFEEMFLQIRTRTVLASLPIVECLNIHSQFRGEFLPILPQFEPMVE